MSRTWLAGALGFVAGACTTAFLVWAYHTGGFLQNSVDTLLGKPHHPTKMLALVATLLVFVALPFAIAEMRGDRQAARRAREAPPEEPAPQPASVSE